MQVNVVQAAAEQKSWLQQSAANDPVAKKVVQIDVFCAHHQASLARKPSILAMDGLATALVRMTHSQHTTKFQNRLEIFMDRVAGNVERRVVGQIPASVANFSRINAKTLSLCTTGWTAKEQELVLSTFNGDWSEPMDGFSIMHWCTPTCCQTNGECIDKVKACLELLLPVPLLYRWKHFEPCLEYAFRGLAIHQIMSQAFAFVLSTGGDLEAVEDLPDNVLDADEADLDPGFRQRVRMNKTWKFFSASDCLAS